LAEGLSGEAAELATGQAALGSIAIFPLVLIFVFIGLYLYMKNRAKPDLSTLDTGLQ